MHTGERLQTWLQDSDAFENPDVLSNFDAEAQDGSAINPGCASSLLEEDTEISVDLLSRIDQEADVDSEAFSWLLSILSRESQVGCTHAGSITAIRRKITEYLGHPLTISRKLLPLPYMASFKVEWDPIDTLQQLDFNQIAVEAMLRTITITGTVQDGQVLTAEQYLCQTWPVTGPQLIRHFEALLAKNSLLHSGIY